MSKEKNSTGVGLLGGLLLVFLFLKLGQFGVVANWSWWWVLAPVWAPWVIAVTVLGITALVNEINNKLNR
jgi:hypothetical protein